MMGAIGTGNVAPGVITASFGTSGTIYAYSGRPVVDPKGEIAAFCDSTGGWLPLLCTMNVTLVTELFRQLFGCDHAEVGGEVAKHWGFPADIREAIARHHEVPLADSTPLLDAVVVGNVVAKTIETGLGAEGLDLRIDGRCRERLRLGFARFSRVCLATMTGLQELKGVDSAKSA